MPAQRLKPSTVADYTNTINNHAVPFLGELPIATIGTRELDAYVAAKVKQGLSGKTIQNHLRTLSLVFDRARRWQWIHANPLADFEGPKVEHAETLILTEDEVRALLAAFKQLAFDATPAESVWFDVVGRMTVVALTTALRRGELIGLKWADLELLERRLHVRHSVWRGKETTPKSRASRRTLGFGLRTQAALDAQFAASRYTSDESLVFGHPDLGTPLDPAKITKCYLRPAMVKAGITKPGAWHLLRHTSLTATAAVSVPAAVQARAGHSSYAMTQKYVHMAQLAHPDATIEQAESRLLGASG
jgi:integrase